MSYFTPERKATALEELKIIHGCAEEAGIKHALFIGFGLFLGIVRNNPSDFIEHDDDMDVCIQADKIAPAQELAYYKALDRLKMFRSRRRVSTRPDPDGFSEVEVAGADPDNRSPKCRFNWFSLRPRRDDSKCCNWFMFKYKGFYWHTKGSLWISERKFDPSIYDYSRNDDALMKGIPAECVDELITVPFYDMKVQIPANYGTALDFWYPGWRVPKRGGASAKRITCRVKKWGNPKTWVIRQS